MDRSNTYLCLAMKVPFSSAKFVAVTISEQTSHFFHIASLHLINDHNVQRMWNVLLTQRWTLDYTPMRLSTRPHDSCRYLNRPVRVRVYYWYSWSGCHYSVVAGGKNIIRGKTAAAWSVPAASMERSRHHIDLASLAPATVRLRCSAITCVLFHIRRIYPWIPILHKFRNAFLYRK